MNINIATHLPLKEREAFLQDNCDDMEKLNYMRKFTEEEVVLMKNRLSTVAIEMDEIEDEKKELIAHIKSKVTPLKQEHKQLLTNIKLKAQAVFEEVYKFIDHEKGIVEVYNKVGDLVESRKISPEERQGRMFPIRSVSSE